MLTEKIAKAEALANELGLGQYQLYQRLGVNASTWSRWKRELQEPKYAQVLALDSVIEDMEKEVDAQRRASA